MPYPNYHNCCLQEFPCGCGDVHHGHQAFAYLVPWCSLCCRPMVWCCCKKDGTATELASPFEKKVLLVDHEILIKSSEKAKDEMVWLGGVSDIHLSLEYMPTVTGNNSTVSVKLVNSAGVCNVIFASEGLLAAGYYIKTDLGPAKPGMSVTLSATNTIARLRWVETLKV